jgi:hypothetical protein
MNGRNWVHLAIAGSMLLVALALSSRWLLVTGALVMIVAGLSLWRDRQWRQGCLIMPVPSTSPSLRRFHRPKLVTSVESAEARIVSGNFDLGKSDPGRLIAVSAPQDTRRCISHTAPPSHIIVDNYQHMP